MVVAPAAATQEVSMQRIVLLCVVLVGLVGCDGNVYDPTMYLTGTEEYPLTGATPMSPPTCASPKVLICHIPPGNPANAHSICVGAPAVPAHQSHHGDLIGACASGG